MSAEVSAGQDRFLPGPMLPSSRREPLSRNTRPPSASALGHTSLLREFGARHVLFLEPF